MYIPLEETTAGGFRMIYSAEASILCRVHSMLICPAHLNFPSTTDYERTKP